MKATDDILNEFARIQRRYGGLASTQEASGVIAEEWNELQDAIRCNRRAQIYEESIQLAACALRLAMAIDSGSAEFLSRSGLLYDE